MKISNVAVVGAGVMGSDIALALAAFGYHVLLNDFCKKALEDAKKRILKNARMMKMMGEKFHNLSENDILSRIDFLTGYDNFDKVGLVIENITEEWSKKRSVYKKIQEVCLENTLYAANTSCVSITQIASVLAKPQNVIGTHFMNPAYLNPMVETIRGIHTSKETEQTVCDFLRTIGKNPVVVEDSPGFVSNRLSHLFMNEAAFLVQENVADPERIDMIFKQGYGHKMGPLETADLIGLDTVLNSLNVLYESYQDPKFRCCPLLKKMVNAGLLGRKSGRGFYQY